MKRKAPFIFAIVIILALSGALCVIFLSGADKPAKILGNVPDCSETVTGFFDCVVSGELEKAQKYISNDTPVDMSAVSDSEAVAVLFKTLKSSYSYYLVGEPEISGPVAQQRVNFTSFCLGEAQADIQKYTKQIYNQKISEAGKNSDLYDAKNNIKEGVAMEIFDTALNTVLQNSNNYLKQTELNIQLKYQLGEWKIVADDALVSALLGKM